VIKHLLFLLILINSAIVFVRASQADFDERYWERYAEIQMPMESRLPPLGGIALESWYFDGARSSSNFSDIRILNENKEEIPYQISTRSPETYREEIPVRILNLSRTKKNESYFMGILEKTPVLYNTIDILTEEHNFYRQVKVFGSMDGLNWNLIRGDAVIFDYSQEGNLRHTTITFNDSNYRQLGILIINDDRPHLKIKGLKVFHIRTDTAQEAVISSQISRIEDDKKNKQSILIVGISSAYPADKISLSTSDRNFQRKVEVFVKNNRNEWIKWHEDIIFNFDTERVKDSKLSITFPEISANDIKIIIHNYDSPALKSPEIAISGYKKVVIFKTDVKQRYYFFWGNPLAKPPHYDISELVAKHGINTIPLFNVGVQKKNPEFSGHRERLPFTERYKYLLYGTVILLIAGLIALQYKVLKKA